VDVLSPEHLAPLALLVIATTALCLGARRRPGRWVDPACAAIALVIVAAELSWQPYAISSGSWSAATSLPVQLCDLGAFAAAAALVWRLPLLVEIAYFWGLGGTVQALATPDLTSQFPSFPYLQFYLTHGLVVLSALFLVVGLRLRPRPGAVRRIFLLTLGFAVIVALIDLVTGGNYMYLRRIPPGGSLLSLMGPWPWYILSGTLLALALLALLAAPFRRSWDR
jgi:hypothetical integral membrane protein (TIGR02206 family)